MVCLVVPSGLLQLVIDYNSADFCMRFIACDLILC